jgi:hypothetical protein
MRKYTYLLFVKYDFFDNVRPPPVLAVGVARLVAFKPYSQLIPQTRHPSSLSSDDRLTSEPIKLIEFRPYGRTLACRSAANGRNRPRPSAERAAHYHGRAAAGPGAPHPPQLSRRSKRFSSVSQAEPRRGREATFRLKFLPVLFLTADPGLAHLDAHQSIRIDLVGILFEDCQVGEFARFKRAELVGHSDLTSGVDGHRA